MKKDCSNCARERFSIPCYDCLIGGNKTTSRWEPGEDYVPETVSLRAAQVVRRRAKERGVPVPDLLERIGVSPKTFSRWETNNKNDISAYFLQQMLLDGYDVAYILAGKMNGGVI